MIKKNMARQSLIIEPEDQEAKREWYYCDRYDIMVCKEVCESRRQDPGHWKKCKRCPLFMPPKKRRRRKAAEGAKQTVWIESFRN